MHTRVRDTAVLKYATIVLDMRTRRRLQRPQLIEALFPAYRRRILGLMMLRSDESFQVRDIRRVTGVPAGFLRKELKALRDARFLAGTLEGGETRYQADRGSPIFYELAAIFRKAAELESISPSRESGAMWRPAPVE